MKMIKRTAVLLMSAVLMLAMTAAPSFAESTEISGEAHFDGSNITSDFSSEEVAKAFTDLQPGDDITVTVMYQNDYSESTDWYMANEVIKTLEKANSTKTGKPEDGGYTYSLIHTDKNGNDNVLFSNDKVGGKAKPANMEGLEQATNALDDWFYIQTLGKNENGYVTLNVKFEGETEVNDYMDTDGEVLVKFAVELTKSGTPAKSKKNPKHQQNNGTKTGDMFMLGLFLLMILAGIAILALLLRKKRHEEGGEA